MRRFADGSGRSATQSLAHPESAVKSRHALGREALHETGLTVIFCHALRFAGKTEIAGNRRERREARARKEEKDEGGRMKGVARTDRRQREGGACDLGKSIALRVPLRRENDTPSAASCELSSLVHWRKENAEIHPRGYRLISFLIPVPMRASRKMIPPTTLPARYPTAYVFSPFCPVS